MMKLYFYFYIDEVKGKVLRDNDLYEVYIGNQFIELTEEPIRWDSYLVQKIMESNNHGHRKRCTQFPYNR